MPAQERYHALDAARAIALLLGITLHAACSFMPGYTRWVITDSQAGPAPAAIAFVIHASRMPLFFMMAGFFARLVCMRKGVGHFVRDRLRRILIPLVAGWFVEDRGAVRYRAVLQWVVLILRLLAPSVRAGEKSAPGLRCSI